MPRSKYNNIKTTVDGITFDSKAEAKWFQELRMREKAGEIHGLKAHPMITIYGARAEPVCVVEADAYWFDEDGDHYGDYKGRDNAMSRLKRKLAKHFAGVEIELFGPAAAKKRRASSKAKPKRKRASKLHQQTMGAAP